MTARNQPHEQVRRPQKKRSASKSRMRRSHEEDGSSPEPLQLAPSVSPSSLQPADILAMQQVMGNRAVQRLLAEKRNGTAAPGQEKTPDGSSGNGTVISRAPTKTPPPVPTNRPWRQQQQTPTPVRIPTERHNKPQPPIPGQQQQQQQTTSGTTTTQQPTTSQTRSTQPPPVPTNRPWRQQPQQQQQQPTPTTPSQQQQTTTTSQQQQPTTSQQQQPTTTSPLDQARQDARQWIDDQVTAFTTWSQEEPQNTYFTNNPNSSRDVTETWRDDARTRFDGCADVDTVGAERETQESLYSQLRTIKETEVTMTPHGGTGPAPQIGQGQQTLHDVEQNVDVGKEGLVEYPTQIGEQTFSGIEDSVRIEHERQTGQLQLPENTPGAHVREVSGGAVETFSALGSGVVSVIDFAGGVKLAIQGKGREAVGKFVDSIAGGLGTIAKGAKGILGIVKGTMDSRSAGAGVLNIIKECLGPIPDLFQTIGGIIKLIYAAVKKKGKEAAEATWETIKSGVNTVMETVKTVFNLVQPVTAAIPLVGAVAKGIAAIMSGGEAAYLMVKKIFQLAAIKRRLAKLAQKKQEVVAQPANTDEERTEKQAHKERLEYLQDVNRKRGRNLGRGIANKTMGLVGDIFKLGGAIVSAVAEIVSLAGVTAPGAAVAKGFGIAADIFGSVLSGIGKLIEFLPKVAHTIRQWGRNIAAKQNWLGKLARKLGFNPDKSSAKKHEKRKEMVTGLMGSASEMKTEFDPSGKDKTALLDEIKAEAKKYDDLDFELDATGVDKKKLYGLNTETDNKRVGKQAKLLYNALKER